MRKRNFAYLFDKLFWTIIMLLPVIMYLVNMLSYRFADDAMSVVSFADYLINMFGINTAGAVYTGFLDIFTNVDFLGVLNDGNNALIIYMIYVFIVELLHVVYDVLAFIPRFAHKLVERSTEVE